MNRLRGVVLFLTVACCALALWLFRRQRARVAAAAALRAQREAQWLRRLAEKKRVQRRLSELNEESLRLFESMPQWVESAERYLDQAELDFAEGAFAPFWNSIESAAHALAAFYQSVQRLESNSCEYADVLKHCETPVRPFPVTHTAASRMKLAAATSHRMHGIVRRAQRDFYFSVIYEHRKTNQILVAGFRNLAEAVEEMASRITSSIDGLTATVEKVTSTFEESLRRLAANTERAANSGGSEKLVAGTKLDSGREQKVLEVLDRIERNRYRAAIEGV